jgi:hypothetical protein
MEPRRLAAMPGGCGLDEGEPRPGTVDPMYPGSRIGDRHRHGQFCYGMKLAKVEFVDDGAGINRFIARRPIFAFSNSDGDLQMLQWTAVGPAARFAGIVHHTNEIREYAYDRPSKIGQLDKAWDDAKAKGWTVVDMKQDWRRYFRRNLEDAHDENSTRCRTCNVLPVGRRARASSFA